MKKIEIESFVKSLLLFFISMSCLVGIVFYNSYQRDVHSLEDDLYFSMQIASLEPQKSNLEVSYIPRAQEDAEVGLLYMDDKEIFALFKGEAPKGSLIKVSYPLKGFLHDKNIVFEQAIHGFLLSLLGILILSILFSLYALYPLRKSLSLTSEFIKDILHDFNTPLATIRLNASVLNAKQRSKNLEKIQNSVETILSLQNNLKEYIENHIKESEVFDIKELVLQRVEYIKGIYPHIHFETNIKTKKAYSYKDGLIRILDNILSNACKYNSKDGRVTVILHDNDTLEIQDTGIGIKRPKKIFDRFYKENSRGLGIGLHIVKKLSRKMDIKLHVQSKAHIGTTFKLDLSKLILH